MTADIQRNALCNIHFIISDDLVFIPGTDLFDDLVGHFHIEISVFIRAVHHMDQKIRIPHLFQC